MYEEEEFKSWREMLSEYITFKDFAIFYQDWLYENPGLVLEVINNSRDPLLTSIYQLYEAQVSTLSAFVALYTLNSRTFNCDIDFQDMSGEEYRNYFMECNGVGVVSSVSPGISILDVAATVRSAANGQTLLLDADTDEDPIAAIFIEGQWFISFPDEIADTDQGNIVLYTLHNKPYTATAVYNVSGFFDVMQMGSLTEVALDELPLDDSAGSLWEWSPQQGWYAVDYI